MEYESVKLSRLIELTMRHWQVLRIALVPVIIVLMLCVYWLVYATGGIKYVFSHSMYLVILFGGFVFGLRGGLVIGLAAGLVLGPIMPINVDTGEQQNTLNWIYRTGFFMLAGSLCGIMSDTIRTYIKHTRWVSRNDVETGLANRASLIEKLGLINGEVIDDDTITLAVISLDNVSEIEKTYGPKITSQVAGKLYYQLTKVEIIEPNWFRISLGQFALLSSHSSAPFLEQVLSRLIETCSYPVNLNEFNIHTDVRIGYTLISQLREPPELILRKAEQAARFATEKSQQYARFSADMESSIPQESLELLGELRIALASGQLYLHYQPKVELASGIVKGVEALMRWRHPVKGNIPPDKFILRAEQSTLIDHLTEWALCSALEQLSSWRGKGINITVAVNVSSQNLLQRNFSEKVLRTLKRYNIEGKYLELEVTESALIKDMEQCVKQLNLLAAAGVVISIDDFGTGFSSLQYLHDLPVSVIKIDRKFIQILEKTGSTPIVNSAINMAHDMGMTVIAEGVEGSDGYENLAFIGCDMAQGYLISKPLSAEEFGHWYSALNGIYTLPLTPRKPYITRV